MRTPSPFVASITLVLLAMLATQASQPGQLQARLATLIVEEEN
jgi:hypothetical protein